MKVLADRNKIVHTPARHKLDMTCQTDGCSSAKLELHARLQTANRLLVTAQKTHDSCKNQRIILQRAEGLQ